MPCGILDSQGKEQSEFSPATQRKTELINELYSVLDRLHYCISYGKIFWLRDFSFMVEFAIVLAIVDFIIVLKTVFYSFL